MPEQHGGWAETSPPPGWLPPTASPALPRLPPRPVYREPHPIRTAPLLSGLGAASLWFALFGSIGRELLSYAWWTVAAAISAWLVAGFLSLFGDRGAAVGVALASGLGLSIAASIVGARWITTSDWPLW
ncbi:hypothetical protein AB0368_31305 [Actinoplanes sp. NPDC051475]|uniref:hypothetical protein n=1 Tax=Actinoplanes sp. NPDC051475 TaxID=3157225 RepID=UPI00344DADFC